jgi:hypothetical protein
MRYREFELHYRPVNQIAFYATIITCSGQAACGAIAQKGATAMVDQVNFEYRAHPGIATPLQTAAIWFFFTSFGEGRSRNN